MPMKLGRIPSPPDSRDLSLEFFLDPSVSDLEKTNALLQVSRAAKATKAWAAVVTPLLANLYPAPPAPPPAPTPAPSSAVLWTDADAVLDQGDFGTCVGNGWAQWGNTLPVDDHFDETAARAIYYAATVIDGAPDNPDAPGGGQQGTTVRAGAKAMQQKGRLSAYAFASTTDAIIQHLTAKGPVVAGTDWTNDMFRPDADGRVKPTGGTAGGHCYLIDGYDPDKADLLFLNSWGSSWGANGRFRMAVADFASLLSSRGEACAALELA